MRLLLHVGIAALLWWPVAALAAGGMPVQATGVAGVAAPAVGAPLRTGCNAASAEPALVATGQMADRDCDLAGRQTVNPYAKHENQVTGTGNGTSTAAITMKAAQGAGIKLYATDIEIQRSDTGTTPIVVTLNDSASTPFVIPNAGSGGVVEKSFETPLQWAANTAATCTASVGVTTLYCNFQGFKSAE